MWQDDGKKDMKVIGLVNSLYELVRDSVRYRFIAGHGMCPFAETDPVWDDPDAFEEAIDELINASMENKA